MKPLISWALVAVAVFGIATRGHAQVLPAKVDTLVMDVPGAEQRLVSKSLILLAARYQVNIAESEVTQARAWYNPNIVYTQSLYDPKSGSWLDNNPATGQVDVQINQLFSIAGKHINQVRLARIEVEQSKYSFDELALSLKYEMYSDIASLYNAQQTDKLLDVEIAELDKLIFAGKKELSLGATAGNDVIRLQAERQSTIADKLANLSDLADLESRLRVLLGYGAGEFLSFPIIPAPASPPPTLDSLLTLSASRPDVLFANADVDWNNRNLALQRSTSVPDLVVGTEYDRRSSYVNNLWTVHAGIDIPIFNRNQGNIK